MSDIDQAVRCLVRATEALLSPTNEDKAAALLWCGIAMLHIANSDKALHAQDIALDISRRAQQEAAP